MNRKRTSIGRVVWRLGMLAVFCCAGSVGSAKVTVVAHWRMGEDDQGVMAGAAVASRTRDRGTGKYDLPRKGAPQYATDTPSPAVSTVSVAFPQKSLDVFARSSIQTLNHHVGIECWVKAMSAQGEGFVVFNGDGGACGYGLLRMENQWQAFFGGVKGWNVGPVSIGAWTHLAVVVDEASTTVYVNGVATTPIPELPMAPTSGVFMVGAQPDGKSKFQGYIDEVRLFTFAPGEFQIGDLLIRAGSASATGVASSFQGVPLSTPAPTVSGIAATPAAPVPGVAGGAPPGPFIPSGTSASTPGSGSIAWQTDSALAFQQARNENKKVLIYFSSAVALNCRKLDQETFGDPELRKLLASRFVCLRVNVMSDSPLVRELGVYRAGTLVSQDPFGKTLIRIDDFYISAGDLQKKLQAQ